jgi:3-methylfumaryl-CoA hydratase
VSASPAGAVSRSELIVPEPAEALAGVLDVAAPADVLPPLWHWVYLLDRRPQRDLGPDGHPMRGIPAPPGPGRLRMFAGGAVRTLAQLRFGEPATRTTRVLATKERVGRTGPLTFVTVRSEIAQDGAVAVVDDQEIVYRAAGTSVGGREAPAADPLGQEAGRLGLDVDPVLLFRFSALTYNAHRIHYDHEYVREEGYPDLVVHGPLQALLMGEVLRRAGVPLLGRELRYRLLAPTYGSQRLTASFAGPAGAERLQVRDGRQRLTAEGSLV